METANLFYVFGGLFALAAIVYFTWTYIVYAADTVKLAMLVLVTIILFFTARYAEEHGY